MRLWILGGEGLLGTQLQKLCLEKGISFVATSRKQADISRLASLQEASKQISCTHIINCAAYTDVDKAESQPQLAYLANSEGPKNVAIVADAHGAKVVHLSTDYVFDGEGRIPYKETDPCHPVGVYGMSKWEGEKKLLEVYPSACIVRTSWIFGKGGKNFISSIMTLMQTKEELKVVSDQRGRPTYAKDLAEAVLSLLPFSGIFHFANGQDRSRFEIAEDILEEAAKKGIPLKCKRLIPVGSAFFPAPAKRPQYSVLCTKKFEEAVNLSPRPWKIVLEEYIRDAAKIS